MKLPVCTIFLAFQMLTLCTCSKETNGKREGFRSQEQIVVTVNSESVDAVEKGTSASSPTKSGINNVDSKKKRYRERISASDMMKNLKVACSSLKEFSVDSKYAQDLINSAPTSEMLSREFKQLDTVDQCEFAPYSAALRIFLRTCSVIDSCPMPSLNPVYKFKLPTAGSSKNDQFTPAKISQSYVAVPNVFAPKPANVNERLINRGVSPGPVLNFARLPSSLPSWIPVLQMMQMQQAAQRAIASRLRQGNGAPTPAPVRRTTPESDATD